MIGTKNLLTISIYDNFLHQNMKVTVLQLDIEWGNPIANINHAESLMSHAANSDLYVLPEMWSTGFATEPFDIAENEEESISLKWMKDTAKKKACAICGSLAVKTSDNSFRNRHYFIDGKNGTFSYYDKHHLFRYGHEDTYYQAGEDHTIVSYCGIRFLLLTCYDLRFPVWSRYSDNLQFDTIICVANWPESRQNAWHILTHARAIENQAYLIGCNRVGDDHYSHYRGSSMIVSPIGKTLDICSSNTESSITQVIDIDELLNFRNKFKVLEDRDIF